MADRIAARLFAQPAPEARRVAHFELERRLGAGGMGVVFAARDLRLDRRVAIKLVRSDRVSERERIRLLQEARALARVAHPNVVGVFEIAEFEGAIHIAMELVDGQDLHGWQRTQGPDRRRILAVYVEAGRGLAAVHAAGLVHRDFKPRNVLISRTGQVKVADFGLALETLPGEGGDGEDGATQTWRGLAGTPQYLAPELIAGAAASPSSDQFSFCVALWEALTGSPPFSAEQLASGELPPLPSFAGPRWLRRALARGLAADPERRWPELAALLEVLHGRPSRRRRVGAAAIAGGAVALAWGLASREPEARACERVGELDGVWDARVSARVDALAGDPKTGVNAAIARTLADELGSYARRWGDASVELCELVGAPAEVARGERCLRRARSRAAALVERLLDGAPGRMDELGTALEALPAPHDCLEPAELADGRGAWAFDWARETLLAARLDAAVGLAATGREAEALALLTELDDSLGDELPQVRAEVLLAAATAARHAGATDLAYDTVNRAVAAANASGRPDLVARVLIEFARLAISGLEDPVAARVNLELARGALEQVDEASRLHHELLAAQAALARFEGDYDRSVDGYTAAIAGLAVGGENELRLDTLRAQLAHVLAERGELEQALAIYAEVLQRQVRRLGPSHPQIATLEADLGATLFELERWELARPHLQRAAEIQTELHPGGSSKLAQTLVLLAATETELGGCARAIELAERAQTMQTGVRGVASDNALRVLAWAEVQCEEFAASLATHERLLDESPDLDEQERYAIHETLSWLLCRLDRTAEAEVHAQTALLAADPLVRAQALLSLAEVELRRDRPVEALQIVARVLAQPEAAEVPSALAHAHWIAALAGRRPGSGISRERLRAHEQAAAAGADELSAAQRRELDGHKDESDPTVSEPR